MEVFAHCKWIKNAPKWCVLALIFRLLTYNNILIRALQKLKKYGQKYERIVNW